VKETQALVHSDMHTATSAGHGSRVLLLPLLLLLLLVHVHADMLARHP
jgi:hypothetical protein